MRLIDRKGMMQSRSQEGQGRRRRLIAPSAYRGAMAAEPLEQRTMLSLDVAVAAVLKTANYEQTSGGAPVLASPGGSPGPFEFNPTIMETAANTVTSATFTPPGGASQTLIAKNSTELRLKQEYNTQAAMDAAYPNGTYSMQINTVNDGVRNVTFALTGNQYPAAPHLTSACFSALQGADPSKPITITWDPMSNGTTGDYMQLNISDNNANQTTVIESPAPGAAGALNGTSTSFIVPASTFVAGHQYDAWLQFIKITARDTTDYPGPLVGAVYGAGTDIHFTTNTPRPNLSAAGLSVLPVQFWSGRTLGATRSYDVSGLPVAGSFYISYRLSTDKVWGDADDILIAHSDLISSVADKSLGRHTALSSLVVPAGVKPGMYYLLAKLDSTSVVAESNETDNVIVSNQAQVLAEPNDAFTYRTSIIGAAASVSGTNVGATMEAGEPAHAGYVGGHSVWWTWTASDSGRTVIDTTGSSFTTLLGVYVGSKVSALSKIGSSKGGAVAFNAVRGQAYQIAVDGYNGAVGSVKLSVKLTPGVLDEKQAATLGSWRALTGGYQGTSLYTGPGNGANTATWTFSNLAAGTYRVSATWLKLLTAATNAPFKIYDGNRLLGTMLVNEKLGPVGTSYDGAVWQGLGSFKITSGSLVIKLSNYANGYVVADGVRIEKVG